MKLIFFLILLSLLSCSDDTFRKVETLGSFRILGVVADKPEVSPGDTVSLQLYVTDVDGGGRTITGSVVSCIDPGIAYGATVSCDNDPATVSGSYTINTITDTDLGSSHAYTGAAQEVEAITIPGTLLTGRSNRERINGVGYITIFTFVVDGKTHKAFKTIKAVSGRALNNNPTLTDIQSDGVSLTAFPAKNDKIVALADPAESYSYVNIDNSTETKTEAQQIAWYVSSGKLSKPKTNVNESTEYLGDAKVGTSVVLGLIRDERGGFNYLRFVFP